MRNAICALAFLCAMSGTVMAQWLSIPLPGTPRTSDGKPNLNAAGPRTADGKPDLSGIWKADSQRYNQNLLPEGTEAPMLPWADALYKHRVATEGYDRPMTYCMPHGVPDAFTPPMPFKIIQTPAETIVLFEEFHKYRQIHTDGRKLPQDPDPAWYGYSIGRWDGDTFVVETSGFKEGTWLDDSVGAIRIDEVGGYVRAEAPLVGQVHLMGALRGDTHSELDPARPGVYRWSTAATRTGCA